MVLLADFVVLEAGTNAWSSKVSDFCILFAVLGDVLSSLLLFLFNLLVVLIAADKEVEGDGVGEVAEIGGDIGGEETDNDDVIL